MIVLHECQVETGFGKCNSVPALHEEAAFIAENIGLDQQHPLVGTENPRPDLGQGELELRGVVPPVAVDHGRETDPTRRNLVLGCEGG